MAEPAPEPPPDLATDEEATVGPGSDVKPRAAVARTPSPAASAAPTPEPPSDEQLPGAADWRVAVAELAAEAEALSTKKLAEQRAATLFEVGRILAHRVGDWTGAEARFEAALQASPNFVPALRELVRLCAAREDWARAVDLLARQATAAGDPAGQTAALLASAL